MDRTTRCAPTLAQIPSYIAETGKTARVVDLMRLRPGTPLRLRRPGHEPERLSIAVETLEGRPLGSVPGEDALWLRRTGQAARGATVTALVPGHGRPRVLIDLEVEAA